MYEIHLILQKKEKSTNDTSIERDLRLMLERNDKTGIVNRHFKVVYAMVKELIDIHIINDNPLVKEK